MAIPQKKKRWPIVLGVVLAVLVAAVVAGFQILDSYLLQRARVEANAFGASIGRSVQIGDLSTKFLGGLGVALQDIQLGPAPGENAPLVSVKRIEVKGDLVRAAKSMGKDVQLSLAEVDGLAVNILKLKDGTTNLQQLQKALDEREKASPEKPAPSANEEPTDLSAIRVDHAALVNGTVRFVDQSKPQPAEVAISKLNVQVNDLRAGKPLKVEIRAAVLAAEENFALDVGTMPLPNTLRPTPETVTLSLKPTDLSPLAPFVPENAALKSGKVDADFKIQLGGAVPQGQGPTQIAGVLHAMGLSFEGVEVAKPLDVVLETDLSAEVVKGELDIRKLRFNAGPAGITGKGRVKGLLSEAPAIEGLEIIGHDLDPAVLATYYPPLKRQLPGEVAGPIGLVVRAAGTQEAPTVAVDLDFTPVRMVIPSQMTKAAGAPMKLEAQLRGAASGMLRFETTLDMLGADLRPGGNVNKAPGQALKVVTAGTYQPKQGPKGESAGAKIELASLNIHVLEDSLQGKATWDSPTFDVALSGAHLDVDKLLIPSTEPAGKKKKATAAGSADSKKTGKKPESKSAMNGHATIKLGTLVAKKMEMKNVVLDVTMEGDVIAVKTLTLDLYGGKVDASGTTMERGDDAPFQLKAKVANVDVAQLMAQRVPQKVLAGKLNCDVDLKGVGFEKADLSQTLVGAVQGNLGEGIFLSKDLLGSVATPLAKTVPFGTPNKLAALSSSGGTPLGKELPFGVELKDGVAQLKKPLQLSVPQGNLSFDGGVHLDGKLNLNGTVALSPETIRLITGGKVETKEPLPIAMHLTGPAWAPQVEGLDLKPAAAILIKQAASGLASKYLGDKAKVVDDLIGGANGKAAADAAAAQKKAEAEQKAREEAERLKQQAQDQAKNKLKGLFGR